MKFDTAAHELAYRLAEDDWEGDETAPSGAFAAVDLDESVSDQRIVSLALRGPHLIVTENSDGIVAVRGYEKDERDRLIRQYRNAYNLWLADIAPADALAAIMNYQQAAEDTSTDDAGDTYSGRGLPWSQEAQLQAQNEVIEFITSNGDDCREFAESHAGWPQVGIDFWLTRNRHGAGFWDRGVGAVGQRLTDAAHPWGELHVWLNEQGELEFEGA